MTSKDVEAPAGDPATTEMREGLAIDVARLDSYLADHLPGFAGPARVRQFKGGQSNPTYLVQTPGRDYVLRRKPPGVLLASAHAVDREFRVISALAKAGYPVAEPFLLCTDPEVIGTPFYVMARVAGRIFWDPSLPEIGKAQRRSLHEGLVGALADLHRLDPAALGLGDFGKPGNYFARQIARWSRQYTDDPAAGRLAAMDRLVEWLPANVPPGDETVIVHGDYRIDNVIFHPSEPEAAAVIDWELSTLGHPLADITYLLLMYRIPPTLRPSLAGRDCAALGVPSAEETLAFYCARTGRPAPPLDFYYAYNLFRFAAICHGIRGRVLRGNASSSEAARFAAGLEPLADLALAHARQAGA